jgi:hypothetical protein
MILEFGREIFSGNVIPVNPGVRRGILRISVATFLSWRSGTALEIYSGDLGFKCWSGDHLS